MNNTQAGLIAAAIIVAGPGRAKLDQGVFATAQRYKQWLDGQDTLAGRQKLAGNIWEDEKDG